MFSGYKTVPTFAEEQEVWLRILCLFILFSLYNCAAEMTLIEKVHSFILVYFLKE